LTVGDVDIYGGEFSLISALFAIEPLREMFESKDARQRAEASSILKNATILAQISQGAAYESQK
jgi:hypothetical protein